MFHVEQRDLSGLIVPGVLGHSVWPKWPSTLKSLRHKAQVLRQVLRHWRNTPRLAACGLAFAPPRYRPLNPDAEPDTPHAGLCVCGFARQLPAGAAHRGRQGGPGAPVVPSGRGGRAHRAQARPYAGRRGSAAFNPSLNWRNAPVRPVETRRRYNEAMSGSDAEWKGPA